MADIKATDSINELYFFALSRVIEAIYYDEDVQDVLYFIVNLATEMTNGLGSTIRVLSSDTYHLKLLASHGLTKEYLSKGALDKGRGITEINEGDIILISDIESDKRVQDREMARKEGIKSIIGIPFTIDEDNFFILRVYFPYKKVFTQDEVDFLIALGRLGCICIHRAAVNKA